MDNLIIQFNTESDIAKTNLQDNLKLYALQVFGWQAQIDDSENPGNLIDNPVSYIQVIFGEAPMERFWAWLSMYTFAQEKEVIQSDVDAQKNSVTLTIIP